MSKYKVGSGVKWTSQAKGYYREKHGTVVRVLNQGDTPWMVAKYEFPEMKRMFDGYTLPGGGQEAYLVCVKDSSKRKPRLYMPYPSKLENSQGAK